MAEVLLPLGLIGSGFLVVPILTGSSAYALAEAFGWKRGLAEPSDRAKEFYSLIAISTCVGIMINFVRTNPIRALLDRDHYCLEKKKPEGDEGTTEARPQLSSHSLRKFYIAACSEQMKTITVFNGVHKTSSPSARQIEYV
jgi:hypothetical protein